MQKITFNISDRVATNTAISIYSISDPSEILENAAILDVFTKKWSANPFLLTGFIIQFMKSNRTRGWTPLVLVATANEKIVGTIPLMIKKQLVVRFAQFLMDYSFEPDFVVDDQYRDPFISSIFEYLFKKLNCQFVSFHLSAESPNLKIIEQQCKIHGIEVSSYNQSSHFVFPVESTWDEFQGKKGRRRIIRQIERKIDELGQWGIEYVENISNRPDVFEKILNVEKRSWKGLEPEVLVVTAEEILIACKGSQIVAKTKTEFKCSAWFLQINGKIVAYTYVIKYMGRALIHKTAYDYRYKKYYVGKYIMHNAIHDMFNEGQIKIIDFMGDFAFMSFWTSLSYGYVKVLLRQGSLATFMKHLRSNTLISRALEIVLNKLPEDKKQSLSSNLSL